MLGACGRAANGGTGKHGRTMKITGPGPIRPTAARANRVSRNAKSADFSSRVSGETASTTRVSTVAPLGAVDGLLVVQEVPDATDGRSHGIARGADLLDRLDEIRHALLCGAMARESLADLRRHVQARRPLVDDARLGAILDEIDLRASVELTKLGTPP